MSYTEQSHNQIGIWIRDWISDWFGLVDILVGIITLTFYYPKTQNWWFDLCCPPPKHKGNPMNIIRYELSKDKQGLIAYFNHNGEQSYHIHSDEMTEYEVALHAKLTHPQEEA